MKQRGLIKTIVQEIEKNAQDSTDYFKGVFPYYLHRKLRRLAESIYLVTNHVIDSEPLKNILRTEVSKLVTLSLRIKGDRLSEANTVLYWEIIDSIASTISFLEVSAMAGMISEANYYLINKELNIIFTNLEDRLKNSSNPDDSLTTSFFNIEMDEVRQQRGVSQKDTNNIKDKEKEINTTELIIKDNNLEFDKSESLDENKPYNNDFKSKDKSKKILRTVDKLGREKAILGFFEEGKKMMIKDISILLPQYGEKTIQREILRLVAAGILSKSGKKRWTLYFRA